MHFAAILFWICALVIFYNYIGYGLLLAVLVKIKYFFKEKKIPDPAFTPAVTLVIAAFNEEDFIRTKIRNSLDLNYPRDKFRILFVTDGSTDKTPDIISEDSRLLLLHQPERRGKTAALNRAMRYVETPIVIFSDANTLLNREAVRKIVGHYADPRVGGVAGEKKILDSAHSRASGVGEGIYWKYESLLKKLDASFYTVVGAAGELFSVRTGLYEQVEPDIILDDFIISLRVSQKGYRIEYEPEAFALETPSASISEEQKRKIRICAGGFQSIVLLKSLLNIFRYPALSFQYISHRVLRWTLAPLCLPVVLVANLLVVAGGGPWIYEVFLALQVLFYAAALLGLYFTNKNIRSRLLHIPYYFLFMNYSVYLGFFRFLRRRQSVVWEKAAREKLAGDPA